MAADYTFNSALSARGTSKKVLIEHQFRSQNLLPKLSLEWGVYRGSDSEPVVYGKTDFYSFIQRLSDLAKLRRQHNERLAAISLDSAAQKLLEALDRETSIRWEDLPERAEAEWRDASRAAAILAIANLCEASPTRIRLSEYGDKLLAESSKYDQAYMSVEG